MTYNFQYKVRTGNKKKKRSDFYLTTFQVLRHDYGHHLVLKELTRLKTKF